MALASLAFGIGAGITCSQASCGFAKNLRHDVFAAVQRFSFANIDQFSASSLVTRLTTDITNVQLAYMMIIRTAVRCPLLLIAGIVMAFIMAGPMAFVFVVIVPILGFGLYKVVRTVHPIFRSVFHKYDALNESIEENVTGMRDVKSYVAPGLREAEVRRRRAGRVPRLHARREDPRAQHAHDELRRVHGVRRGHPVRQLPHHLQQGHGCSTWASSAPSPPTAS